MSIHRNRSGVSLIEVLAGLTLVAILIPSTLGMLNATQRFWFQFDSGRSPVENRQAAMQELNRIVLSLDQIQSYSASDIRFRDKSGSIHRILSQPRTVNGRQVFDLVDETSGGTRLLAESIGRLEVQRLQSSGGSELIELRISNLPEINGPTLRSGTTHSSRLVWKKP
jgi:hypothetical protein